MWEMAPHSSFDLLFQPTKRIYDVNTLCNTFYHKDIFWSSEQFSIERKMAVNPLKHFTSYHIDELFVIGSLEAVACCLVGTNPSPEPMLTNCQLYHKEHTLIIFLYLKFKCFQWSKAFEYVCKTIAILFRAQSVRKFSNSHNTAFNWIMWHLFSLSITEQRQ